MTRHALIGDLLQAGLDVRVPVTGASMRPLLRGGEVVTVSAVGPASLEPGDLLLCRGAAGTLVLHRLLRVEGSGDGRRWVTGGDALNACDAPFAAGQILGRVTRVEGVRLPLVPASLRTDSWGWRLASCGGLAFARVGRLVRRAAGCLARCAGGAKQGRPCRP